MKFPPKNTLESARQYCVKLNSLPAYSGQSFSVIQHKRFNGVCDFAVLNANEKPEDFDYNFDDVWMKIDC